MSNKGFYLTSYS